MAKILSSAKATTTKYLTHKLISTKLLKIIQSCTVYGKHHFELSLFSENVKNTYVTYIKRNIKKDKNNHCYLLFPFRQNFFFRIWVTQNFSGKYLFDSISYLRK